MTGRTHDRPEPDDLDLERPRHPTRKAVLLLVAVTIVIVVLAALSSWGTI